MRNIVRSTLLFGLVISSSAYSEVSLKVEPSVISPTNEVIIELENACALGSITNQSVDHLYKRIRVTLLWSGFTCPSGTGPVNIGSLPSSGTWDLTLYVNDGTFPNQFDPSTEVLTTQITVNEKNKERHHEVPSQDSVQSGVGLIRGWACDADRVEISIDGGDLVPLAYGTTRGDTESICNDTNNGYGMVMAWGLLGEGTHRMQTFVDGEQISDVQFEVAGIGEEFAKGLNGTYELQDFPAPGESVTIEWSEAAQNFIIVDHSVP